MTASQQFSTTMSATLTIGGVSATFTVTTVDEDKTPDAFQFQTRTGEARNAPFASNAITISGINAPAPVSITGGEYSIGGGAYTSAPGTISNSQTIQVRLTSSTQFSSPVTAALTVGGVTGTFTVSTKDADTTPDAFQFARQANATRGAWVPSSAATIAGIDTAVPVTIENGEYSINGGAFTSTAGSITEGQSLTVRVRASSSYSKSTRARVTVGNAVANFEVMSELPNYVPDGVAYDGQDVVYLLSGVNKQVYRWSLADERYLDAYAVGTSTLTPAKMAYSSDHKRLYFSYSSGAVQYIDTTASSPAEVPFLVASAGATGLVAVGKYLLVQGGSIYGAAHYIYDASGTSKGSTTGYTYYSSEFTWDPVNSRVYFFRDGISPNDVHYEVVDQTSGAISPYVETPYHGAYAILPPIRVSVDGQYVLIGSGDIYSQSGLTWAGSVGSQIADARWFANGSVVTLTTATNQTTLRRLGGTNNQTTQEQLTYTGQALRIVGSDTKMAVLLLNGTTVQFRIYVPKDDSDGDGVKNTDDAFPLDAAASVDSDHDGYPDAWNAGKSQSDSTSGLSLDAYPNDTACYLPAHGDGVHCDYGATIPNYTPDQIINDGDTIYLLSSVNKRVYRWSIATGKYLNPYAVGINQGFNTIAPTLMAFSSNHHRLYLGYSTGAIRYIDTSASSGAEVPFGNTSVAVAGLASVGNFLLAQDGSGAWATHYVFNASGTITDQKDWNYHSREYAWDPVNSRVYFFRDDTSPNDLHYEVIDQTTGKITTAGETPYHGDYNILPPIRVSPSGQYVLLGSGDLYTQPALTWAGSMGSAVTDARWLANASLVTLTTTSNQTTLRHLSASLVNVEQVNYTGQALRVVGSDSKMVVVLLNGGTVQFSSYVPKDDSDGDGVLNAQDAFPLDAAASIDTDRDGHPDAWNAGKSQSDSTTGLTLDAYPNDFECYLVSHGSGGSCDYGATMPSYVPDQVTNDGATVFLLSSANRRVYRWSITSEMYLKPYVVGMKQGFASIAPTKMAFSSSQHRLYLGYATGAIQYVDTTSGTPSEVAFGSTTTGVYAIVAAGNYLVAQDGGSYGGGAHYVFSSSGAITDQKSNYYYYYSSELAWDPVNSRVYLSDSSGLRYEVVDQGTGRIGATGVTPYNSSSYYAAQPPLRVSTSGQYILAGNGDLYDQSTLARARSLGSTVNDGRWLANGSLVTLTTTTNSTTNVSKTALRRLNSSFANVEQLTYTGQALRVVGTDAKMALVLVDNNTVKFYPYVPNDDSDADGVPNTTDAFPLDPAASVDTDHDGYPDAWNAGKSQSDSTSSPKLTLDVYPNDSACHTGASCDYDAAVPNYVPDQVINDGNIVYLLSGTNNRVYRWSLATGAYLNPLVVGSDQGFAIGAPTKMGFSSSHHRLYLGYSNGAITYLDTTVTNGAEVLFARMQLAAGGLAAVGNYVLGQDASGGWATHYIFDSSGALMDQKDLNYYSREYAWDPVNSRVYFFRDNMSPNDLHYEVIDQTTGKITSAGETPYHGDYNITPPIRVTPDGQYVLLGSGDMYRYSSDPVLNLKWARSLGSQVADARWFANGSLVTLTTANNQTALRRLAANTTSKLEQLTYTGQALRVVGSDTKMAVLVLDNSTVKFYIYVPSDDNDGDGVNNPQDAFPLDPAASVDTDHDGHPDAWNAGMSQSDSTSSPKLTLDAYPNDAACYTGATCDYNATVPAQYIPDQVINDGDIVYLLSSANKRVYRWSAATGNYLNPYVVGLDLGYGIVAPTKIAYSSSHHRLYIGYAAGAIQYIDTSVTNAAEVPFANVAVSLGGLTTAGNYVVAQDNSNYYGTHSVFDSSGTLTDQSDWSYFSREYAWDPVNSRLFFFRDGISPNDVLYEVIDQTTGKITSNGETPYHGSYVIQPPIRVSPDGKYVMVGSGDVYLQPGLTWSGSLGKSVTDIQWKNNVLVDLDSTDRVEIRDVDSRAVLQSYQYTSTQPIRIVVGTTNVYLVHVLNNTVSFLKLPFGDQDSDTIPKWWEQLYGLDDNDAADAGLDPDGDGVTNAAEYANHSNPQLADTDGDGLTDQQEIVTYHTDPAKADSDGDGLSDKAEVITYHTDPLDTDSDNDGYTDLDEVTYGGNPNDPSGLPQPLVSYSQTFDSGPLPATWTMPQSSSGAWAIDTTTSHSGSASLKSGTVASNSYSGIQFRAYFSAGQVSFYGKMDNVNTCCGQLYVLVDGAQVLYMPSSAQWTLQSFPITQGIHSIEWRYIPLLSASSPVWIDDVTFVKQ